MKTKPTAPKVIVPATAPTAKPDLPDMPTVNELATLAARLAQNKSNTPRQELANLIHDAEAHLFEKRHNANHVDPWAVFNPIVQQDIIVDAMVKLAVDVDNNPPLQDKLVANALALWKACHHRIKDAESIEFTEMVFKKSAEKREKEKRREAGLKSPWEEWTGFEEPISYPVSFNDFLRCLMPKMDSETKRLPKYREFVRWFLNLSHYKTHQQGIVFVGLAEFLNQANIKIATIDSGVIQFITHQKDEYINESDFFCLAYKFQNFREQERKNHASKAAIAKAAAAAAAKAQRSEPAKK